MLLVVTERPLDNQSVATRGNSLLGIPQEVTPWCNHLNLLHLRVGERESFRFFRYTKFILDLENCNFLYQTGYYVDGEWAAATVQSYLKMLSIKQ